MATCKLELSGFTYQELLHPTGLARLDQEFLDYLTSMDQPLSERLLSYRVGDITEAKSVSQLIIDCAPIVETFIANLFNIQTAVGQLQGEVHKNNLIFNFKKQFVLRNARRQLRSEELIPSFAELNTWLLQELTRYQLDCEDREFAVARFAERLLQEPQATHEKQSKLTHWCVQALKTQEGREFVSGWVSFHLPQKLTYENLVDVVPVGDELERLQGNPERFRQREGFKLTDSRMSLRQTLDHVHYCVYCHKTEGDFCSKGFPVKKNSPDLGYKVNPLNEKMIGCPLDEKISEMNFVKEQGYGIAALAVVMIDNPMCPATGHRICNDCMKACIYQKQEPVNIPQVETRVLMDVLSLPWGVEIYDLLTRWNPLRQTQVMAKPYNGKKVLVMGMGPAGFTLAHHLLMEGFAVVGADGLKIEALPAKYLTQPIYDFEEIKESLDDRLITGFGGVAEYGITVRWDKNFLKLIYLTLLRRPYFQVFGSVRFGGTLSVEDVWELGFDHLAVAVGAGLPRELKIPHSMAPGMRQANDFLMALQLTGAAKSSSLANLEVRLPALVIGGGLTGIDTATEVQAYYIKQVEKVFDRYTVLAKHYGEQSLREQFDECSLQIIDEFLVHAARVKQERERAMVQERAPNFIKLIHEWGGVTIIYRRTMQESPAYRRNHEEVEKAFEEGIYYAEGLEPAAAIVDKYGFISGLKCQVKIQNEAGSWIDSDYHKLIAAKSIFVATGAKPNIAYEYEHRGTFKRVGDNYQRFENINGVLVPVDQVDHCKAPPYGAFTSYARDHHRVSFLGDTHLVFHGSVVKAIASAKKLYPSIVSSLAAKTTSGSEEEYYYFRQLVSGLFQASVHSVKRLSPSLIELKVRAPMAARNYKPGHFYRIQNYETNAEKVDETLLQTEAMAMLGIQDENEPDLLTFFVIERGASSRLVSTFKPLDLIAVMGPTGVSAKIPETPETILIIGGTMAMAELLALGPALRQAGHRVMFVSALESKKSFYNREQLERAADVILWVTVEGAPVPATRVQDRSATGELVLALRDYALGQLEDSDTPLTIKLQDITRAIVVGSPELVGRVAKAAGGLLKEHFQPEVKFFASVFGAMQCMLKGVCAQCLQWQLDPKTGKRTKAVYACSWQEQPISLIDIENIRERLSQNRASELLTNKWLDYLFEKYTIIRV